MHFARFDLGFSVDDPLEYSESKTLFGGTSGSESLKGNGPPQNAAFFGAFAAVFDTFSCFGTFSRTRTGGLGGVAEAVVCVSQRFSEPLLSIGAAAGAIGGRPAEPEPARRRLGYPGEGSEGGVVPWGDSGSAGGPEGRDRRAPGEAWSQLSREVRVERCLGLCEGSRAVRAHRR